MAEAELTAPRHRIQRREIATHRTEANEFLATKKILRHIQISPANRHGLLSAFFQHPHDANQPVDPRGPTRKMLQDTSHHHVTAEAGVTWPTMASKMESDLGALPRSELGDISSDEPTAKQQPRINTSRTKAKSKKTHADSARRKGGRTGSSKKTSDDDLSAEEHFSSDDEEDSSSGDSGTLDSDDEVAPRRSGRNHRRKKSTQQAQQGRAQPRSSQARTTANDPSPPPLLQQQMAYSWQQNPQFMPPPQPLIYNNPPQEQWRLPQGQDHAPAEQVRFLQSHAHPPMDRFGFPPNQVSSPAEQLRFAPQSMAQPFPRPDSRAPLDFMATRPRPPDGSGQYLGMMPSQADIMSMVQSMIESQLMARPVMQPSMSGPATSKSRESTARPRKKPAIKETSHHAKARRSQKLEYKRLDQVWDPKIHSFTFKDTAEGRDLDEYDEYLFTVKRQFDWKGKYTGTVVSIKSAHLRTVLRGVMDGVKGVSLVEDTPTMDPNMLFMYLDELRQARKRLKAEKESGKEGDPSGPQASHVKVLLNFIDEDYREIKSTFYPLVGSGLITFDLLWALFKPNTIAYTTAYGNPDEPRAFKVDYAVKESDFQKGSWYRVHGRYLEYDGKVFGMGSMDVEVSSFKGASKITTLAAYPIQYHKDEAGVRRQLIERGRKFVTLKGMNYRYHQGMAFYKKKRAIVKVNINGRVMVDSAIYRRLNPNYPVSAVHRSDKDEDDEDEDGEDDDEDDDGDEEDSDGGLASGGYPANQALGELTKDSESQVRARKLTSHLEKKKKAVADSTTRNIDKIDEEPKVQQLFTEEQLLLSSPLVLGFAFSEKLWLEFTISGLRDIEWNDGAFSSLVLPENQKSIVKALVESHTFHAAQNVDDVIQGKGRGLVAVLHGPPGTGKTLTAEGIAELLRRPLYMVSAGELGTDPRMLEAELNKLLDLSHSWGAVLLLDEADVFLEKRTIHDIHRNALVSIFLRLLEYFQGILFLTTNRVETFDDAFQSRIHVALRYGELTPKAKKTVWRMFVDRVKAKEGGLGIEEFKESDLDALARNHLNGRQIKNCVRTAQALAVNNNEKLSMAHIKRVLDVIESFDRELKGGTGYVEAMRSYT